MSFVYPWVLAFILPTLLLVPLIKSKATKLPFHPKMIASQSHPQYHLLPIVLALVLAALARPVVERSETESIEAQPLFIAIDFSASMRAEDVKPSRLERAKAIAADLVRKSPFKNALILFTTNPLIIAPPTSDKEALLAALRSVDPDAILTKGTDFRKLLEFVGKFAGHKNLVIISDGGDFADTASLRQIAKQKDITIYAVGVGTRSGALVPTQDGYLKKDGRLVVSRLNPAFKELGSYYEDDYLNILDSIGAAATKQQRKSYEELYYLPLLAAFLLYLYITTTFFERVRRFKLFALIAAVGLQAGILDEVRLERGYEALQESRYQEAVQILQKLPYFEARFGLAVALCEIGKVSEAAKIFGSLKSRDAARKAKIYYNLGICYEKMRKFDAARESFVRSCQLEPSRKCADKIAALVFKHDQKKQPLPFAKQKIVAKKGSGKDGGSKSGGSANMSLALQSGAASGGKRKKGGALSKKGEAIPLGSKVYELINKGYVDEKNPW